MKKFALLLLLLLFAVSFAAVCYCSSCLDCTNKLNSLSCREIKLTQNINTSKTCISDLITFSNKTFDCQGYTISHTGTACAVYYYGIPISYGANNKIVNCKVKNFCYNIALLQTSGNVLANLTVSDTPSDFGRGITMMSSSNNSFSNITIYNNSYGFYISNSDSNNFSNIRAYNHVPGTPSGYAFSVYYSSNNFFHNITTYDNDNAFLLGYSLRNRLANITLYNNSGAIHLYNSNFTNITAVLAYNNRFGIISGYGSSNNIIYDNFFNNTVNMNSVIGASSGTNHLNTTKTSGTNVIKGSYIAGNYWATPSGTGFSETCIDSDSDGICDSRYSAAINNIDYLPLTKIPACTSSCSSGQTQCSGSQIQYCTYDSSSGCYYWGSPTNCPSGQTCSGGTCTSGSAPTCSISWSPASITAGSSSTLNWNSTGATSGSVSCSGIIFYSLSGTSGSSSFSFSSSQVGTETCTVNVTNSTSRLSATCNANLTVKAGCTSNLDCSSGQICSGGICVTSLPTFSLSFVYPTPSNGESMNRNWSLFNVSSTRQLNLVSVNLSAGGASPTLYYLTVAGTSASRNMTNLRKATTYTYSAYGCDIYNNCLSTETRTLKILGDTKPPLISILSPVHGYTSKNASVTFGFITTDDQSSTMDCSMHLNGFEVWRNESVANGTATYFTLSNLSVNVVHRWKIRCSD